jgi:hypothetical protein
MSEASPDPSNKVFDRETAEALARSLKEYPHALAENERLILEIMVYWLTDPIERLKLGPAVQFSQEEEAILQRLERGARRLP